MSFEVFPQLMAQASTATPAAGPSLLEILVLPLGFLFIMLLMMRPQAKKAKEHAKLLSELKAGDEVITSGGLIGKVRSVADQFVTLEIANNTLVKVIKQNILSSTAVLNTTNKTTTTATK